MSRYGRDSETVRQDIEKAKALYPRVEGADVIDLLAVIKEAKE